MEFKQLEAFVNVIRYKSFSRAAEATYLTQPTISTHISSLENELGVKLIDRRGKESRPTKHGRAFYNYAVNIINTRERAMMAMKEFDADISGSIDIRSSSIPGQFIVPELLAGEELNDAHLSAARNVRTAAGAAVRAGEGHDPHVAVQRLQGVHVNDLAAEREAPVER